MHEPEAEGQHEQCAEAHERDADPREAEQQRDLRWALAPARRLEGDARDHDPGHEDERPEEMEEQRHVPHRTELGASVP